MAETSPTPRSTRRLSEVSRHLVIPEGIVTTGWPAVEKLCDSFDTRRFTVWQRGLGAVILGKRADGKYAATVGGVSLSMPRQVTKTFLVGRILFALAILCPGLVVLWTAHRTRLSSETFRKLKALALSSRLRPHVAAVRSTNGEQEIAFVNGSRILFGAREAGFGLGFDEVDVIVFDEAQRLSQKGLDDMIPAANQSRQPTGALLFYMGTPPRPTDAGEVFRSRREEALAAKAADEGVDFGPAVVAGDAVWVECSADPQVGRPGGPSLDDPRQIEGANPSYPDLTPHESMLRMRKQLRSDASWRREGLGVWDDDVVPRALIPAEKWRVLSGAAPLELVRPVYAVKFSTDGRCGLAAAVADGESVHVAVIDVRPLSDGLGWLLDWLDTRWRDAAAIVVDGKTGSGTLLDELGRRKVRGVVQPSVDQVITAHAQFLDRVMTGRISHEDQRGLNQAVAVAGKRRIGSAAAGGWGWAPVDGDGDVLALDAATFAAWGAGVWGRPVAMRMRRMR